MFTFWQEVEQVGVQSLYSMPMGHLGAEQMETYIYTQSISDLLMWIVFMHLWACVCITHSTGSVHASWTVLFHDWHRCGRIPAWPGTHTHLPYCSDRHQTHTRTQMQPHPRGERSAGRVQSCSWPHSVTSDPETHAYTLRDISMIRHTECCFCFACERLTLADSPVLLQLWDGGKTRLQGSSAPFMAQEFAKSYGSSVRKPERTHF